MGHISIVILNITKRIRPYYTFSILISSTDPVLSFQDPIMTTIPKIQNSSNQSIMLKEVDLHILYFTELVNDEWIAMRRYNTENR